MTLKQQPEQFISRVLITGLMACTLLFPLSCKTTPPPAPNLTTTTPVTTNSTTLAQNTIDVSITSSGFTPANVYAREVTSIIWTNKDTVVHTVTSDNGLFDVTLQPGGSFVYSFYTPGRYSYHCSNHPDMKGVLAAVEFD